MRPARTAAPASAVLADEHGVSLVEMLIAVIIFSVGILALVGTMVTSLTANTDARNRQQAVDAMSGAIENARALSYDALNIDSGVVVVADDPYLTTGASGPEFDHDGDGPEVAEELITAAGGSIAPYIVQDGGRSVRTYVTWYDPDDVGATGAKRVTVVVTYAAGVETRELRESTVVADANRGLAAPDFQLAPELLEVIEQPGQTLCFDHTLVNEGERDKHSFTIQGWTDFGDRVVGPTVGGETWVARAYLDGAQMTDDSGDLRPDSPVFLARGGSLPLTVCFDIPSTLADGTVHDWVVEVASQLDPAIVRTATERIEIGAPGTGPLAGFQLHIPDAPDPTARTFVMDSQPAARTSLPDYDGDGVPGWALRKDGGTSSNNTEWDWQYLGNGNVFLDGTATLSFFSAWKGALVSGSADPTVLEYRVSLQVLDSKLDVLRTLDTERFSYTHSVADWRLRTVSLDFSSLSNNDLRISKNQYLRLEVQCLPTLGQADCHIALDALVDGGPTYTSALEVPGAST